MERAKLIIEGDVQGVLFRAFIKKHADKQNIRGWVKNVSTHIEAILEGDDIQPLIELCKQGPKKAKITSVRIIRENSKGEFRDFTIK